ncbi:MAG: 3-methyl-2-oxobutanoate hydroxymethyltransferase [Crenarchaeota archaeon 13_1_40CM_3_52_10]|nr:MAG: 3-methyl-2-oxobutanoate hydroxymethyltransferase [Crenarchaeota archaeon 13_1_40CM_3_52_10]OLE71569.1 MAG: 3-methyl-2-oxobutanoate hydroxymethyltransferase [archaeon 13_1_20CM_2_51_12]
MGVKLSGGPNTERKKVTVADFSRMKTHGQRIVMVTSYDYPTSIIADDVGVDSILVGDSYGMVVLGYDTTIPVTLEELLPVCQAVKRGASHSLLIGDMPFLSFQISEENAIRNAGRFIKEGRMEAVKIEGGREMANVAKAVSNAGIPVLGHIGLTPQTATLRGGYRVQGKNADSGKSLIEDAKSLEDAGVFGIVLEMITEEVARVITRTVSVPTIGIGSGRYCDGQVLVLHDILGLYPKFVPKFAKRYTDLASTIGGAVREYASEVRQGTFPEEKHVFKMDDAKRDKLDLRQKS